MNKYAIVGVGLVDSLGSNLEQNWNRYTNGEVAIGPITNFDLTQFPILKVTKGYQVDTDRLDVSKYITDKEKKYLDRFFIAGFYSAMTAIEQCNIPNPESTAVFFGSLGGGTDSTFDLTLNLINNKKSTPRHALSTQRDALTGLISRKFGFYGLNLCPTSACSSGIVALDYAVRLLEDDTYEQVVVGAGDLLVDPRDIYMFQSIGALDASDNIISCPFDQNRKGFVMGEGAATFVVKKLETALKHNDNIISIISGIGFSNESYHETSMRDDGIGGRTSINMALRRAGLEKSDIDLVNAHATSTPNGDEIEYNIIADYFPNCPTMALKANIGHTLAGCGLVETAYMIKSMEHNLVGPVANLKSPLGDKILLPTDKIIGDFKIGLKNSFGFGGKSAALILEKP